MVVTASDRPGLLRDVGEGSGPLLFYIETLSRWGEGSELFGRAVEILVIDDDAIMRDLMADWLEAAGYSVRKTLYNLYHVLNHLNLFGGAYGAQAQRMMEALLSEIR